MKIEQKINNYIRAADEFNNYNKDFKIEVFMNFDTLDIYVHDLIKEEYKVVSILHNYIKFFTIKELVKQYYLLVEALYNEER